MKSFITDQVSGKVGYRFRALTVKLCSQDACTLHKMLMTLKEAQNVETTWA